MNISDKLTVEMKTVFVAEWKHVFMTEIWHFSVGVLWVWLTLESVSTGR